MQKTSCGRNSITPHLVSVVVQHLVLGWSEWNPTGGEGRTVRRVGDAGGAAGIPPGACAHLAHTPRSPMESHSFSPTAAAISTQKKKGEDAHPTEDHDSPGHFHSK